MQMYQALDYKKKFVKKVNGAEVFIQEKFRPLFSKRNLNSDRQ